MTASSSQCPEHKLLFDKEKFYSINQRLLLSRELLTTEKNDWEKKITKTKEKVDFWEVGMSKRDRSPALTKNGNGSNTEIEAAWE